MMFAVVLLMLSAVAANTLRGDLNRQDLTPMALDGRRQFGAFAHHRLDACQPFYPSAPYPIDPYVHYLLVRHVRYLPQGLGLNGIYGSTGLPKIKPPGMFRFRDKD